MDLEQELLGVFRLWARNRVEERHARLAIASEERQRRQTLLRQLREYAEGGKVAMVESGRDCDGLQYSGHVSIIDATVAAWEEHYTHTAEWADGLFSFALMRPSEARSVKRASRDLTLEAFENGHSHVIYV